MYLLYLTHTEPKDDCGDIEVRLLSEKSENSTRAENYFVERTDKLQNENTQFCHIALMQILKTSSVILTNSLLRNTCGKIDEIKFTWFHKMSGISKFAYRVDKVRQPADGK